MKKDTFTLGIAAILISTTGCKTKSEKPAVKTDHQKPNIIFVLADDLGYGDLGSYGQDSLLTPNLDQMAKEGMRFTECYAGNTVCCPSRSSLLTGLHPGHARHRANYAPFKGRDFARVAFDKGTKTIASYLKEASYLTGHVGKWHLGGTHQDSTSALFLGFDHSYSHFPNYLWTIDIKREMRGKVPEYYFDTMWNDMEQVIIEENLNKGRKVYCEELYTDQALDFIQNHKDTSFFLYLAYTIPHAPQVPYSEEPFADKDWPEVERKFAAEVYYLDQNMGKIFSLLKKLGLDENTLVVFSSDNGAHREGGHDHEFFNSNGKLRGYKRDMYDGGIKVPMIVRWPGTIQKNTASNHICAFWDFLPTFCEVANITVPMETDGISILSTLLGDNEGQGQHEYLYWESMEAGGRQGIRMGKWKAVKYDLNEKGFDVPIELYNVSIDTSEQHNIASQHPEIVKQMEKTFSEAREESPYFKFEK